MNRKSKIGTERSNCFPILTYCLRLVFDENWRKRKRIILYVSLKAA